MAEAGTSASASASAGDMAVAIKPLAAMYVGDLHSDVTEAMLKDSFKNFDGFVSVKLCKDMATNKSLGYAYVNFSDSDQAEKAMESLRCYLFFGQPIRIAWSNRDPESRKSGSGNLFVKNLNSSIDNAKLYGMFKEFGKILSCKVSFGNGKSKGIGYVQFETENCAAKAIEELNGKVLEGKEISINHFVPKTERKGASADQTFSNLYVKNIDKDIDEDKLKTVFSEIGKVSNVVIMKDEHGTSKGFGFVNYENHEDAVVAIEKLNSFELGPKKLYVGRAQKKHERSQILKEEYVRRRQELIAKSQDSNLYVKNLHMTIDDGELHKLFEPFGNITSTVVMREQQGRGISKGFGFVCFSSPQEANHAINNLNGKLYKEKKLYVSHAQLKEVRAMQLAAEYANQSMQAISVAGSPVHTTNIYYPCDPGMLPPVAHTMMYEPDMNGSACWTSAPSFGVAARNHPSYQGPMPPMAMMPGPLRFKQQVRVAADGHMVVQPHQQGFVHLDMNHHHHQQHLLPNPMGVHVPNGPRGVNGHFLNGRFNGRASNGHYNGNARNGGRANGHAPNGRFNGRFPHHDRNTFMHNNGRHRGAPSSSSSSSTSSFGQSGKHQSESLTSILSKVSLPEQKQIIGEHMYPLVLELQPKLASKITGMLLEMDNSELLLLLESPDNLAVKVEEAVRVLNDNFGE